MVFDKYFLKRDNILKRRIEIDASLYEKLKELSEIYEASINKLVNVSIIKIVKKNNIKVDYNKSQKGKKAKGIVATEAQVKRLKEMGVWEKNKKEEYIEKLEK